MTSIERRILQAVHDEVQRILEAGRPEGYGWAEEKQAHELATHGIVRSNGMRWLGWAGFPAEQKRYQRTLQRLEAAGLIERLALFEDGNKTHVALTDAGRAALEAQADG